MPRKKTGAPRATPHSKKKSAARDRIAVELTEDEAWAASIRERLLADCHAYQRDAVLDPARRVSILVGRGGGKTTTMRARALIKITSIKRARVLFAATSGPEAERLTWEPTKQLIDELGLRDEFTYNETKLRITCKRTGGTYQLTGLENKKEVNKWRGQPFDEVQVDETASHDPQLLELFIQRAVGPRLGERKGCIVLGGTPGHILSGLFYDATRPGSEVHRPYADRDLEQYRGWIRWSSHAWNMVQVMALPGETPPALLGNWEEALIEKAAQGWSEQNPVWMREYLGLWASDTALAMYHYLARHEDGSLCNMWQPLGARKDLVGVAALRAAIAALPDEFDDYLFGYGHDMGTKDPYACNVVAFSPSDNRRRFWHVFSFELRGMYAKLISELLIGEEATRLAMAGKVYTELGGLFGETGWPVAQVADLAGLGESVLDELANVYGIRMEAADKTDKYSAIELVNGDLVDERAFIIEGSRLEAQMLTLQWKPNEFGELKEDKAQANHSTDAWTYIRRKIGAYFTGAPDAPMKAAADAAAGARERPTSSRPKDPSTKKPPPRVTAAPSSSPSADPRVWSDAPVRSRRNAGGEFGGLLR